MTYTITIETNDGRPIAVVDRRAAARDLSRVVPAACGEVWSALRAARVEGPGRHVAVYLDGAINMEIGVEIPAAFAGVGGVRRSMTPAGRVASTVHIGSYAGLGAAHAAVRAWCARHQHALAGPNWEIYGHWHDDPAELRTDVCYLVR